MLVGLIILVHVQMKILILLPTSRDQCQRTMIDKWDRNINFLISTALGVVRQARRTVVSIRRLRGEALIAL